MSVIVYHAARVYPASIGSLQEGVLGVAGTAEYKVRKMNGGILEVHKRELGFLLPRIKNIPGYIALVLFQAWAFSLRRGGVSGRVTLGINHSDSLSPRDRLRITGVFIFLVVQNTVCKTSIASVRRFT